MIHFYANRQQLLSELSIFMSSYNDDIATLGFEDFDVAEGNRKKYHYDQIAFTVFRNDETWLIHIQNKLDDSTMRVVVQLPQQIVCMKVELIDNEPTTAYPNKNPLDFLTASLGYYSRDEWKDPNLATQLQAKIGERMLNGLLHYTVTVTRQKKERKTTVALLYKSPMNAQNVVLVFRVSDTDGRNDVYSASVVRSKTLDYLLGLYNRKVFTKFLNETLDRDGKSHDDKISTDIKGVYYVTQNDVVCVTRPVANDGATYDDKLEIGRSYRLVEAETNLAGQEFYTIVANGKELQYPAIHFYKGHARV